MTDTGLPGELSALQGKSASDDDDDDEGSDDDDAAADSAAAGTKAGADCSPLTIRLQGVDVLAAAGLMGAGVGIPVALDDEAARWALASRGTGWNEGNEGDTGSVGRPCTILDHCIGGIARRPAASASLDEGMAVVGATSALGDVVALFISRSRRALVSRRAPRAPSPKNNLSSTRL